VSGWCWFALLDDDLGGVRPSAALATATATDLDGDPAGTFAAWPRGRKPVAAALRIDERLVDPRAPASWVSVVMVPRGTAPLFDDIAVTEALRQVLRGVAPAAVSTLVRDTTTFAGSVTVWHGDDRPGWRNDPFGRLHTARLLRAGAGMFGAVPPPPGPAVQRYAGKPWPAPGFETTAPSAPPGAPAPMKEMT
jgi:hypothetical protein